MGNQMTNQQQQQQQQELPNSKQKKKKQQQKQPKQKKTNGTAAATANISNKNGSQKKSRNEADDTSRKPLALNTATNTTNTAAAVAAEEVPAAAKSTAADQVFVVACDVTPSPDSANRTWSSAEADAAVEAPPVAAAAPASAAAAAAATTTAGQRDSGISQLSTEEFERAFEELARIGGSQQLPPPPLPPQQKTSVKSATEELHLLTPRLRVKRSAAFQQQRSPLAVDQPQLDEQMLVERQELLTLKRQSAYSVVNDDHKFPTSVTPCKVDSGLFDDYDVPYMDDDNFFALDDWYLTDDRRWSYLRRSDTPQLADWDDCRLTESVANSAKPTPHGTPAGGPFGGRRPALLFGLCCGGVRSSRAQ